MNTTRTITKNGITARIAEINEQDCDWNGCWQLTFWDGDDCLDVAGDPYDTEADAMADMVPELNNFLNHLASQVRTMKGEY